MAHTVETSLVFPIILMLVLSMTIALFVCAATCSQTSFSTREMLRHGFDADDIYVYFEGTAPARSGPASRFPFALARSGYGMHASNAEALLSFALEIEDIVGVFMKGAER